MLFEQFHVFKQAKCSTNKRLDLKAGHNIQRTLLFRIIPFSKWFKIMASMSPNWGYSSPNGLIGLYIGVTNYLLTGMILQVGFS